MDYEDITDNVEYVMNEILVQREIKTFKPETTSDERTWATLAHLSAILTVLFALPTGGLGGLLLVFVPFGIYIAYKDKSRYVANQAAQAFALQIVATVGFFVAILVGVILIVVVWLITGLLSAILIGLILIPVALLLTLAIILIWVVFPFVAGGLSIVAAVETGNGRDYRYPYLGRRVSDWLAQQQAGSTPAV
jgi:uncharacterized Tic20 family protein